MKILLHFVLALSALGALCFHASQVGAETSIEIRLTLVPAASLNDGGPRWTPCSASLSAPLRTGRVVHAVLKRSEKTGGANWSPRNVPVIGSTQPTSRYHADSRALEDETALPTTEVTFKDDGVEGSSALEAILGANYPGLHFRPEIPPQGKASTASERPVELVKPTVLGSEEVLVLPIGIPAQNGVVPHFRQIAIRLNVILPPEPVQAPGASRVRYTFRSVPLEQLRPLPRANPVLKRARIPDESSADKPSQ